jgi:hypothetical protein
LIRFDLSASLKETRLSSFIHPRESWVVGLSLFLAGLTPAMFAQENLPGALSAATDTLRFERDSLTLPLSHPFVEASSETLVVIPSGLRLARGQDYSLDHRHGIVRMDSSLVQRSLLDGQVEVVVRYRYLPFAFRERYARRRLVGAPMADTSVVPVTRGSGEFELDDIFGPNLQKSGSIVRGITIGSNRDFTLNSGLRLQLAGKISSDVDVVASLTDENTPIQPEGTTQTLQEFDKVFVEFRGTDFDVVLGDFNIDFTGSEFGRLSRKLQGAKGSVSLGGTGIARGAVTASGAIPRGKFHSTQFQGVEGVQGPYLLSGRNGERSIIIIAGTERVFINGERMTRGDINDYTIDYSLAEIRFTARRLVTSASRIVVDFEYTDRQYGRSFVAAQGTTGLFEDALNLEVSFFREGDNRDDPIDIVLDDSSRAILSASGDDRNSAVTSGVTRVDSNGFYISVDTLVAGEQTTFYRYQPGPGATYVVAFSFVGAGQGDYVQAKPGVYTWKGKRMGDYLPIRFVPLPQLHHVIDYTLQARPVKDLTVKGEFAQSRFDGNTFSTIDDGDNDGHAYDFRATYSPSDISVGGSSIGGLELAARHRFIREDFVPIDRVNDIEFTRKWGVDTLRQGDERLEEFSGKYLPWESITFGGGYGSFRRGEISRSSRRYAMLDVADSTLPRVLYNIEDIQSDDEAGKTSSDWVRQLGRGEFSLWRLTPTMRFEHERRTQRQSGSGPVQPGSFRFHVLAPGLRLKEIGPFDLFGEFEWRADHLYEPASANVQRESGTFTQSYQAQLRGVRDFSTTFDVTLREKDVTPGFEALGNMDVNTILLRNLSRYSTQDRGISADLFYEVTTQRSSQLERVFVRVTPGAGSYRYLGDLNNNGVSDETEFELTRYDGDFVAVTVPSEQLVPVTDLKTSMRVSTRPRSFLSQNDAWWAGALSQVSFETYVRLDEKSTEADQSKIYLLHLGSFLRDSTTIVGSQLFNQDVNILDGTPEFSMRLRFQERKSLTQFGTGTERGYAREQSLRIRSQLVQELSHQVDLIRRTDRAVAPPATGRTRSIVSNAVLFDFSYRPEQNLELGFSFELTNSIDYAPAQKITADLNAEGMRLVYSFQGSGQARAELIREEVRVSGGTGLPSFELTGGRALGQTWIWRAGFDYRVARFVQATMSYDGRSEFDRPVVHTARVEVQAFF